MAQDHSHGPRFAQIARREDRRLLAGRGRYTDDMQLPNMAHAALLGSPYAHARIVSIDTAAAKALPGVIAVVTGAELAARVGPMPTLSNPPVIQHVMAIDRVRHVGEPIAAVIAETRYIAEDALALIEVDYEVLPAVVDPEAALSATGDALLHPYLGSNVAHHSHYKWGPVDDAFAGAAHIVELRIRWPRVGPMPMETCAGVAAYDPVEDKFDIWSNMSQQSVIGGRIATALGVDMGRVSFHLRDVGGSFGGKATLYHAPLIAAALAREAGRPVKYVEDRAEHMLNGNQHASDRIYQAKLALDSAGKFTGLSLKVIDDQGAYFLISTGSHGNALAQVTGPYTIGALEYDLTCVLTNKTQQAPYRGFGGEVGNFVLERLVDAAARELGVDGIELRQRNFIAKEQFPFKTPVGNLYDSGDYHRVLSTALDLVEANDLRALKADAAPGKRIGIGLATVNERSVLNMTEFWFLDKNPPHPQSSSPESVQIKVMGDGSVVVTIYAPHWGNSPETMAVQLTAYELQVDPSKITVVAAGTDGGLLSKGPAGSRYTAMLAGAIQGAAGRLRERILAIGAHMLGHDLSEVAYANGEVFAQDRSAAVALKDISRASYSYRLQFPEGDTFRSGLSEEYTYDHPISTLPSADRSDLGIFYPIVGHACHVAIVEIDEALLTTRVIRYVAVHDAGTIVNPQQVDGQIRGGIAQGIGTALYEKYYFDDEGQLLNATLADYAVPTSEEVPDFILAHVETPSPFTAHGIKGCGEGGRLAAMPAIAAAIDDAWSDRGLFVSELPMTPSALHAALAKLG